MSLTIPTIASEESTIHSDLESSTTQTIPLLERSFMSVISKVLAGAIVLAYRFAGRRWLDMFVRYASYQSTTVNGTTIRPLLELGRLHGVSDPAAAVKAQIQVTVTVITATGSLPIGTRISCQQNGFIYTSTSEVALALPTVTVQAIAASSPNGGDGSGASGSLASGTAVQLVAPPSTVEKDAVVDSTVIAGADAEDWEDYRARVIAARRTPPEGGALSDYRKWAMTISGIEAAFPYTGDPGVVDIYCRATEASSGSADGIPTSAQLTAVADYINGTVGGVPSLRPVNDGIQVLAITRKPFDITVKGLNVANGIETRAEIESALDEFLFTREPFIVGLSSLPRSDFVTRGEASAVISQVVSARGGSFASCEVSSATVVGTSFALGPGEHAKLNSVSYES